MGWGRDSEEDEDEEEVGDDGGDDGGVVAVGRYSERSTPETKRGVWLRGFEAVEGDAVGKYSERSMSLLGVSAGCCGAWLVGLAVFGAVEGFLRGGKQDVARNACACTNLEGRCARAIALDVRRTELVRLGQGHC